MYVILASRDPILFPYVLGVTIKNNAYCNCNISPCGSNNIYISNVTSPKLIQRSNRERYVLQKMLTCDQCMQTFSNMQVTCRPLSILSLGRGLTSQQRAR